ncbi:hypothetical protein [Pseudonocardia sp. NPDC049154]|uniref:hypothetical protein n=1 Tax=Pseudonocardia sp. NPDC049154 TaxID=3155501 RepID=UPI0033CA89D6
MSNNDRVELDTYTDQQYGAFVRLADVVGPDAMVDAFPSVPGVEAMAARYRSEEDGGDD